MDGSKHGGTTDGSADDVAMRQHRWHLGITRHQQIGVQHPTLLPWIANLDGGISVVAHYVEQRGILQRYSITIPLLAGCLPATGG